MVSTKPSAARVFCRAAADYFFLLRVPLLAPVWTILLLGWIAAHPHAGPFGSWFGFHSEPYQEQNLWMTLVGFSFVVGFIYVTNQIADIENDGVNGKLFLLPRKIVSVPGAWITAALSAVAGLAIAFLWLDTCMAVLFSAALALGAMYNFPPFQLKDRPLGGTVANLLGHGVITFLVGCQSLLF